ncbi:benzaldehyde dehydrogenase [Ensifer adhaerens]|uniref:benzaldehyde dehydrogenase n=1 Tax=Ensifer adhaerens TaxID=106592 RepID=UPI001F3E7288|nr:benzaldehyde dehydrogenase [Ensifer adhaerens]
MTTTVPSLEARLITGERLSGTIYSAGWREAKSASDIVEPATGNVLGRIGLAGPEDIGRASAVAVTAQRDWASVSYEERAKLMRNAASELERSFSDVVEWLVRESGSTRGKAAFETQLSIKVLHQASALASQPQGLVLPAEAGRTSLARRRPHGVVGVISPFNFPLYLAMRAVAPALALGNAVVLKPDPRTAVCGGLVFAALFERAGLPAGLLHVLPGGGEAGAALVTDPNVAMIQFTGSTKAGRLVGESASRHLKKVSLELGGKNTLIILKDADLDLAVKNAAWGAWLHQGQICMASGRILVEAPLFDTFVEALAEKARSLPVGNPADPDVAIGPIINKDQLNHIDRVVKMSIEQGARLAAGGTSEDLFYAPSVLSDVRPGMAAFEEEIFGPVACVTPFVGDAEAVELANRTEYGLSAAVISPDIGRAMAIGDRLRTGILHINDQTVNDEVVNPFGGVGASGNGTSIGGASSIDEFTHWQWLTIKNTPPAYPF